MIAEITSDNFKKSVLEEKSPVFIYFYSETCGLCIEADSIINEISEESSDVKFYKMDADKERIFSENSGVFSLPTFILYDGGQEVKRLIGLCDKTFVEEMLSVL